VNRLSGYTGCGRCACCARRLAARTNHWRYRQKVTPPIRELCGLHDLERASIRELPGITRGELAGFARHKPLHAAFHAATIVGARDDLLSGVATFVECNRVERVEI
jgi:hypothetical protein